MLLEP